MSEKVEKIQIVTEYLQLQQLLKMADLVYSGGQCKIFLQENEVYVDGILETRRGRKLYPGSKITVCGKSYEIVK